MADHIEHKGWVSRSDCPGCMTTGNVTYGAEKTKSIYIIGSLRNSKVVSFANALQQEGFEAFADWISPGPDADDHLRDYAKARGLNYKETLKTYAARHIFEFDKYHLDRCDAAVMLMPAGKSGHLELGYVRGQGKPGYILFDEEPERIDVMYQFATDIFFDMDGLLYALKIALK
jgi:nucleoside 2-deoxyribosyltransferase